MSSACLRVSCGAARFETEQESEANCRETPEETCDPSFGNRLWQWICRRDRIAVLKHSFNSLAWRFWAPTVL